MTRPTFKPWRDLVAGLSVALVLIPQALAYAELAGLPGRFGLYAAAAAPIAAAFLASSPYLQTGPVALTALLTFGALAPLASVGSAAYVGLAALLALVVGAVRVVVGWARAGWISYLMSQPMMLGFTAGAAILILSSQLPGALGVTGLEQAGVLERADAALRGPGAWEPASMVLAGVTLALLLGLQRVHPRIPAVLIATLLGLGYSIAAGYQGPVLGRIPSSFPGFPPELPWSRIPGLILPGAVIALVGFAEAAAISQSYAARRRQRWDPNREFLSQGVANLASGLASGFPVGGSFSRTSLAFLAGANSRWSGLVTGLAVVAFLPVSNVLAALPRAVLSAIVIGAAVGLIDVRGLLRLWRLSPVQACVAWSTLIATLVVAPRIELAVVFGVLVSIMVHVLREMGLEVELGRTGSTLNVVPKGVLWFGSAPQLERTLLDALPADDDVTAVVLHLGGLGRIDFSAALSLRRILEEAASAGLDVTMENAPPQAERILDKTFPEPEWWARRRHAGSPPG